MLVSNNQTSINWMIAIAFALAVTAAGCGADELPRLSSEVSHEDDLMVDEEGSHEFDHVVVPPREYYEALMTEEFSQLNMYGLSLNQNSNSQILYVNFDGATIDRGTSRGQSFIPCKRRSEIPPSGISPGKQLEILELLQGYYNEVNARVIITANQPAPNDQYTTIVVGGSYGSLGCLGRGILGVAPYDPGNRNRNDIGFAFNNASHSAFLTATTIAHEAAHSFGLDHIDNRQGIMYPSMTNQILGFRSGRVTGRARTQDSPALLRQNLGLLDPTAPAPTPEPRDPNAGQPSPAPSPGPSNPQPNQPNIPGLPNIPNGIAGLPGLDILAGLGDLLGQFQPKSPIDISNLFPQLDQILPGGLSNISQIGGIQGLENVIAVLGLAQQAAINQAGTSAPGTQSGINNLLSGFLNPTNLAQSGALDLQTLISLAGLQGISGGGGAGGSGGLLGGLASLIFGSPQNNNQPSNNTPQVVASRLPDFSEILKLDTLETHSELLNALEGHATVVNSNFTGETREAMLSMLKVAYGQAARNLE